MKQYEVEGDSFLDSIITSDEAQCHHYELGWKQQSMKWQHVNSLLKKKFRTQPSAGEVMCTVFWDGKGLVLLDFLQPEQAINSDWCITMLMQTGTSRVRPDKKAIFLFQHDVTPHISLKTMEHIACLGWTVLHTHCIVQIWCHLTSVWANERQTACATFS